MGVGTPEEAAEVDEELLWEAARSLSVDARHLEMNSLGEMVSHGGFEDGGP